MPDEPTREPTVYIVLDNDNTHDWVVAVYATQEEAEKHLGSASPGRLYFKTFDVLQRFLPPAGS